MLILVASSDSDHCTEHTYKLTYETVEQLALREAVRITKFWQDHGCSEENSRYHNIQIKDIKPKNKEYCECLADVAEIKKVSREEASKPLVLLRKD